VLGVTPLQPVDLPEGAHQVALKNNELGVVSKRRVIVSPNKESLLKLDLFGEKR
jgi:predicted DNA-binding antitoxin AbrB/MazE fold protein